MSAENVENFFPPFFPGQHVACQNNGGDKDLRFPQCLEGNAGDRSEYREIGGKVQTVVASLPDAQARTDDDTNDHRPAGLTEKALASLEGQPYECAAEWNGDTIVGVTTEDAHEEHQQVPAVEVLLADTCVLRDEEGCYALGGQFDERRKVAVEEYLFTRAEENNEDGSGYNAYNGLAGTCQLSR